MSEQGNTAIQPYTSSSTDAQAIAVRDASIIDDIIKKEIGAPVEACEASYDHTTPQGREMFLRHMQDDAGDDDKLAIMNLEWTLVGFTLRAVAIKKNKHTGEVYDPPKIAIRSIMESAEGELIPSTSPWVANDLRRCRAVNGGISPANPCVVKIRKGGPSDRLDYIRKAVTMTSAKPADNATNAKKA
jgi:hypothetical protein